MILALLLLWVSGTQLVVDVHDGDHPPPGGWPAGPPLGYRRAGAEAALRHPVPRPPAQAVPGSHRHAEAARRGQVRQGAGGGAGGRAQLQRVPAAGRAGVVVSQVYAGREALRGAGGGGAQAAGGAVGRQRVGAAVGVEASVTFVTAPPPRPGGKVGAQNVTGAAAPVHQLAADPLLRGRVFFCATVLTISARRINIVNVAGGREKAPGPRGDSTMTQALTTAQTEALEEGGLSQGCVDNHFDRVCPHCGACQRCSGGCGCDDAPKFVVYHAPTQAGSPAAHDLSGGEWFFEPEGYDGGESYSEGYPTREAAEAAAAKWAEQNV